MKRKRSLIIILLILITVIAIGFATLKITGIIDPANMIVGNNVNASGYAKNSFHSMEFESIESAMQAVAEKEGSDYDNMTLIYQATTGNLEKVFMLESTQVDEYEFHQVNG